MELTKPKISHLTEDALRQQDEAYLASLPKPKPKPSEPTPEPAKVPKPKAEKLSREEELFRERWERLFDMVSKGRLDALKSFWERDSDLAINLPIPPWASSERRREGMTLLQVATRLGHEDVVDWLLREAGSDPTIDVPIRTGVDADEGDEAIESDASDAPKPQRHGTNRRAAYDLAPTRKMRAIFRRCAADFPEKWDWLGAGRVPSVLTKEMEDEQEGKKKVKRKGLKEKVREREKEREAKEQAKPAPVVAPAKPKATEPEDVSGPRRLGGSGTATQGVAGLTPEMRAKVERERRARAAEARMKALGQS